MIFNCIDRTHVIYIFTCTRYLIWEQLCKVFVLLTAPRVYELTEAVPRPPDPGLLSGPYWVHHPVPQSTCYLWWKSKPNHTQTIIRHIFNDFDHNLHLETCIVWIQDKCVHLVMGACWKVIFYFQVCLLRRQYQCEACIYLIKFTIPRIQGLLSTLHSLVVTIFYTSICLCNSNQCGARTGNELFISDRFEVKEMEELLCQLKNIHALLVFYLNLTIDIIYLHM